jgi:hypothetical protein
MKKTASALLSLGERYFAPTDLRNFVENVDRLGATSDREFFQLKQEGNDLTLEYGALLANAIIDITMTPSAKNEFIAPLKSILQVHFSENAERARLRIHLGAVGVMDYIAVAKPAREHLFRYADALKAAILEGLK